MVRLSLLLACVATLACNLWTAALTAAHADPIEDFYKGKQVKLVIGSNNGGAYDSYGRLLAAHIGRHIPGSPTVVPANMPGASGVQSATYLYQIAPKDGLTLGLFNQSMGQRQLLEPDIIRFDAKRFNWLGAMNTTTSVFITWHASGVKTLEDAQTRDVVMGALATGLGSMTLAELTDDVARAEPTPGGGAALTTDRGVGQPARPLPLHLVRSG